MKGSLRKGKDESIPADIYAITKAKQAFHALFRAVEGGPDEVIFYSISFKRRYADWLVVARGDTSTELSPVVAFGSGPNWYMALRNLNTAISKGQWKPDKYRNEPK